MIAVLLVAVSFAFFSADLALAASIGFSPASSTVGPGSTTTFQIILDSAPAGLSGYGLDISVATVGTAVITGVDFPPWAVLHQVKTSLPAGSVSITGVDLNDQVQNGSTGVLLATITVRGDSAGPTDLNVGVQELDSDGGSPISAGVVPGHLTVQGAPTPTASPTPTGTPASPTATTSPSPTGTPANPTATPTSVPASTSTPAPSATAKPTACPTPTPSSGASPSPSPGFAWAEVLAAGISVLCLVWAVRPGKGR